MKKPLLKAALICLGITLLCGLYSFRTPQGENLQQRYRTTSTVYDTIIIPDGEAVECVKEVTVENDQGACTCRLHVLYNDITGDWSLYLNQYCNTLVHVEYSYIIKYSDYSQKLFRCKKDLVRNGDTSVRDKSIIAEPEEIECIPVSVKAWACFEKE